MELKWTDGACILVQTSGNTACISANKEGLLSLSAHLAALARQAPGSHLHLDAYNSLEDGSSELLIELTE